MKITEEMIAAADRELELHDSWRFVGDDARCECGEVLPDKYWEYQGRNLDWHRAEAALTAALAVAPTQDEGGDLRAALIDALDRIPGADEPGEYDEREEPGVHRRWSEEIADRTLAALAAPASAEPEQLDFKFKPHCSCMSSFDGEGDGKCAVHCTSTEPDEDAQPSRCAFRSMGSGLPCRHLAGHAGACTYSSVEGVKSAEPVACYCMGGHESNCPNAKKTEPRGAELSGDAGELAEPEKPHTEHVLVTTCYPENCIEGDCEHRDEWGEPEGMEKCPTTPMEVCVGCMVDSGRGADPRYWDDCKLWPWPCEKKPTEPSEGEREYGHECRVPKSCDCEPSEGERETHSNDCICGHARLLHGGLSGWCKECECNEFDVPAPVSRDAELIAEAKAFLSMQSRGSRVYEIASRLLAAYEEVTK